MPSSVTSFAKSVKKMSPFVGFSIDQTDIFYLANTVDGGFTDSLYTDSGGVSSERAQQFIASTTGIITSLELKVASSDSNSSAHQVFIFSNSSDAPNAQIASGNISPASTPGWATVTGFGSVSLTAGTKYWIVIKDNAASNPLQWSRSNIAINTSTLIATRTTGKGLTAAYYNGPAFNTFLAWDTIPQAILNKNPNSFLPGIQNTTDNTTTASGFFTPLATGSHTFYLEADDGAKLNISGIDIIDDLAGGASLRTGNFTFINLSPVSFELQHREQGGGQQFRLDYSYTGQAQTNVPNSRFTPLSGWKVSLTNSYEYCYRLSILEPEASVMIEHSPIVKDYYLNHKLSDKVFGQGETDLSLNAYNLFNKTFAVGNEPEAWEKSEASSLQKYRGNSSRRIVAPIGGTTDSFIFTRTDAINGFERSDLRYFNNFTDYVNPGNVIESTEEDFIEFGLYIQPTYSVNGTSSIQFIAADGQTSLRATFSSNINTIVIGVFSTVKIRKSSFVLSNPLDLPISRNEAWSVCSYKMLLTFTDTALAYTIHYSTFKLTADISRFTDIGSPIEIGNYVSEDNAATWFLQKELTGKTLSPDTNAENIGIHATNDLGSIQQYTLPTGSTTEFGDTAAGSIDYSSTILASVFNEFDEITSVTNTSKDYYKVNYYYIDPSSGLSDYLRHLTDSGLFIVANRDDGSIIIRSPIDFLMDRSAPLEIPTKLIYEYKLQNTADRLFFNKVIFKGRKLVRKNARTIVGYGDGVRLIPADSTITFVYEGKDEIQGIPINNNSIYLDGFQVATTPDSNSFNNTGISILQVAVVDRAVILTLTNTNFTDRYLRAINIIGDGVFVENDILIQEQDNTSIAKYGLSELEIDSDLIQSIAWRHLAFIILEQLSNPTDVYELQCQYIPNLELGQVVKFKNAKDITTTGFIIGLSHSFNGSGFTSKITIKEHFLGSAISGTSPSFSASADTLLNGTSVFNQLFGVQIPNNQWINLTFNRQSLGLSINNGLAIKQLLFGSLLLSTRDSGINTVANTKAKYRISYRVVFKSNATGIRRAKIDIFENTGNPIITDIRIQTVSAVVGLITITDNFVYEVNSIGYTPGLYITVSVYQNSGADLGVIDNECYFRVIRIT